MFLKNHSSMNLKFVRLNIKYVWQIEKCEIKQFFLNMYANYLIHLTIISCHGSNKDVYFQNISLQMILSVSSIFVLNLKKSIVDTVILNVCI